MNTDLKGNFNQCYVQISGPNSSRRFAQTCPGAPWMNADFFCNPEAQRGIHTLGNRQKIEKE
jgi:hypothetical protein